MKLDLFVLVLLLLIFDWWLYHINVMVYMEVKMLIIYMFNICSPQIIDFQYFLCVCGFIVKLRRNLRNTYFVLKDFSWEILLIFL